MSVRNQRCTLCEVNPHELWERVKTAEAERDRFRSAVETVANKLNVAPLQWDIVIGEDGKGGLLLQEVTELLERVERAEGEVERLKTRRANEIDETMRLLAKREEQDVRRHEEAMALLKGPTP